MIRMSKALLDAWLADLRSGPPQGKGRLFDGDGYCCLGRLQIAAGDPDVEHGGDGKSLELPSEEWLKVHNVDFGKLGKSIMQNPNVRIPEGLIKMVGDERSLAGLNDDGVSFRTIADIIEKRSLAGLNDDGVSFRTIADIIETNAEGV